jgi:hypothetical protein
MSDIHTGLATLAELVQAWHSLPLDFAGPASEAEITYAEQELGVIFPQSYRTFLRRYGAGYLHFFEIYGIPGDRLWGDVVIMNRRSVRLVPRHYVKFTGEFGQRGYYLDTSQMNAEGECPVIAVGPSNGAYTVADNFVEFLRKASEGLI